MNYNVGECYEGFQSYIGFDWDGTFYWSPFLKTYKYFALFSEHNLQNIAGSDIFVYYYNKHTLHA